MDINTDMRSYLDILEYYSSEDMPVPAVLSPEPAVVIDYPERLADIVFKLRSHLDDTGGEYSLGFEQGLEMAARMIDNLINMGEQQSGS